MGLAQHTRTHPGVYWGAVDVVFVAPPTALSPNTLRVVSGSLIATAGLVQRQVMEGPDEAHVVSDSVTLLDEGIFSGYSVTLPNAGGQWANNFERPALHVQASDPDEGVALARLTNTVHHITSVLDARQTTAGVLPLNRITTRLSPANIGVAYYPGSRTRGTLSSVLLGLGMTIGAMTFAERRGNRCGPRRRQNSVKW